MASTARRPSALACIALGHSQHLASCSLFHAARSMCRRAGFASRGARMSGSVGQMSRGTATTQAATRRPCTASGHETPGPHFSSSTKKNKTGSKAPPPSERPLNAGLYHSLTYASLFAPTSQHAAGCRSHREINEVDWSPMCSLPMIASSRLQTLSKHVRFSTCFEQGSLVRAASLGYLVGVPARAHAASLFVGLSRRQPQSPRAYPPRLRSAPDDYHKLSSSASSCVYLLRRVGLRKQQPGLL